MTKLLIKNTALNLRKNYEHKHAFRKAREEMFCLNCETTFFGTILKNLRPQATYTSENQFGTTEQNLPR